MSSEAASAKPAVPEPPTLDRAYKDELFLNLGLLEAGCTRIVEYAVTPAILYYTWVKIADEEVTATTAHVSGLKPESSIVTRVTVRNSAGSATSATSGFFTTLSEAADRDVRLKEARDAASTARSDYDRVYAEVTALRTRIAELEVAASGSDSAKSARIAQLESELAKLRTELPEALARIETQKREIKTLVAQQDKVSQLHAEVDTLRRESRALREQQDASVKLIAGERDAKAALEAKLAAVSAQLAEAQSLAAEKDAVATELQERATQLQEECVVLRNQLQSTQHQSEQLDKEVTVCKATISELQAHIAQMEAGLEAAKSHQLNQTTELTESYNREVQALKARIGALMEELTASEKRATEAREAREKEHALQVEAAVSGHSAAVKLLTDEVAALRLGNEKLTTDLDAARAGIRLVQESTKAASDQQAAKVAGLEEAVGLSRRESDRLRAEAQAAVEQAAEAEASHRVALEQAQAATQAAMATIEALRATLAEEQHKRDEVLGDRRAAQDVLRRAEDELVALRFEMERLRSSGDSEVRRLRDELAASTALNAQTMSSLITDVSRLEAANAGLMSQVAVMRQQSAEDQALLAKTQGELWELKTALSEGGVAAGSSHDLAAIRSDFNACYLMEAFEAAGLRDARLEAAYDAFWALKEMGFNSGAARHAVVRHPDDKNLQVAAAMSYTPPKKSGGWFS